MSLQFSNLWVMNFIENGSDMNIIERANELLEILEKAAELKKMKCYDPNTLELKPGKKK